MERTFKTKLDLAYEIVKHQSNQIDFDFVSADGYYGNDADFARKIEEPGYLYMLDIHANQSIYLEPTELEIPARKSTIGPTPKKLKATQPAISVTDYMSDLTDEQWQKLTVRNTTKGKLTGHYHFAKVYIWKKAIDRIEQRLLVIRKTMTTDKEIEIKFSFANANLEQYTPKDIKELIIFQLHRQMTDDQMYENFFNRHIRRQPDINNAYLRQNPNLLK